MVASGRGRSGGPSARETNDARHRIGPVVAAFARTAVEDDHVMTAMEALRDLVGADDLLLYELNARAADSGHRIARWHAAGGAGHPWRDDLSARLQTIHVQSRLAAAPQRAVRIHRWPSAGAPSDRSRDFPIGPALYTQVGVTGREMIRGLIADGGELLGWVDAIYRREATASQSRLLSMVLPALRERLRLERAIEERALAPGAVDVVLEEIGAPAWIVRDDGSVVRANAAARERLRQDRAGVAASLRACVTSAAGSIDRFRTTRFLASDGTMGFVVVEAAATSHAAGVAQAAQRFGLTQAQSRVLVLLARGEGNAAIATELGITERTVEAHVTAILAKARVSSRAALVVAVFSSVP